MPVLGGPVVTAPIAAILSAFSSPLMSLMLRALTHPWPCLNFMSSVLMLQTFLAGIRVPKDHRRPPEVWQSFLAKLFLEWVPRKGSGKGASALDGAFAGLPPQSGGRRNKAAEAAAAAAKGIGHGSWQQAWWVGRLRMDLLALEMALQSGNLVNGSPVRTSASACPQQPTKDGEWWLDERTGCSSSASNSCPSAAAVPVSIVMPVSLVVLNRGFVAVSGLK